MNVARHQLQVETTAPIEVIDISDRVRAWVRASGVRNGLLTVMSLHTTARVNLNERESELQHDMVAFLTRLVPREGAYRHNVQTVDDRDNAHAHLLGLMLNASESIPVADGALVMGGWQSIFFIELDGPRARREVELHLIGEA
ncbi:MAG: secondary thiamine-phosphate synthase enzyme YjbQ [Gemmatimonadaceae bacterium]|nr:secondary thiamine-phosphate synthase enzyme YjbQ [Gemmatimonadaceae bacterium]MCC6432652.1 YjbQ family protein [Gemmatimonadaceae bacterium]